MRYTINKIIIPIKLFEIINNVTENNIKKINLTRNLIIFVTDNLKKIKLKKKKICQNILKRKILKKNRERSQLAHIIYYKIYNYLEDKK